jgi:hypothetical protein
MSETIFCLECHHLENAIVDRLFDLYENVLAQLTKMIDGADQWTIRPAKLSSCRVVDSIDSPVSRRRRIAASPRQEA